MTSDCTRYDLSVRSGADVRFSLTIADENGDPLDITGWTFQLHAKENITDPTPAISAETGSGAPSRIEVPTPTNGQLNVILAGADTAALNPVVHVYDLKSTSDSNEKSYLIEGQLHVSQGVVG